MASKRARDAAASATSMLRRNPRLDYFDGEV